jgi:hypothetical protein
VCAAISHARAPTHGPISWGVLPHLSKVRGRVDPRRLVSLVPQPVPPYASSTGTPSAR